MRIRTTLITLVGASLLWSSSAMAQQAHVASPSVMQQAIAAQAATDQQNRDVVLSVLHQSRVREIAANLGLNVTDAEAAVSTLNSADLARVAGPAHMVDAQLAGGDVIVISVTTLLLIVILVVLLAR